MGRASFELHSEMDDSVPLSIQDSFAIRVTVWLNRSAFAAEGPSAEADASASHSLATRRFALSRLLDLMNKKPERPATRTPGQLNARPSLGGVSGGGGNSGGGGGTSGASAAEAMVVVDDDEREEDDDGEKLSNDQLQSVYSRLGCDVNELTKYDSKEQPRRLRCTLHEYQRQGVGFMRWRELPEAKRGQRMPGSSGGGAASSSGAGGGEEDDQLDPSWAKYRFPSDSNRGLVFYLNPSTGAATLERPSSELSMRGGVLADEMGLGKTVMMIAVILADVEEEEKEEAAVAAEEEPVDAAGMAAKIEEEVAKPEAPSGAGEVDMIDLDSEEESIAVAAAAAAATEAHQGGIGVQGGKAGDAQFCQGGGGGGKEGGGGKGGGGGDNGGGGGAGDHRD